MALAPASAPLPPMHFSEHAPTQHALGKHSNFTCVKPYNSLMRSVLQLILVLLMRKLRIRKDLITGPKLPT